MIQRDYLYNQESAGIDFLIGAEVLDTMGVCLGYLSKDRRLLRVRRAPRRELSPPPPSLRLGNIPEWFPLAPLFQDFADSPIDIFEEEPGRFRYVAATRPDMD